MKSDLTAGQDLERAQGQASGSEPGRRCDEALVVWGCRGKGHVRVKTRPPVNSSRALPRGIAIQMLTSDSSREDRNLNFYVKFPLQSQITYQLANWSPKSRVLRPVPPCLPEASPCLVTTCTRRCHTLIVARFPPPLPPPSGPPRLLTWATAISSSHLKI